MALFASAFRRYRRGDVSRLNLIITTAVTAAIVVMALFPSIFQPLFNRFEFKEGNQRQFIAALIFCLWIVVGRDLPLAWLGLAVLIAASNTLLELFSPRGTDDMTMATANAFICWAFAAFARSS